MPRRVAVVLLVDLDTKRDLGWLGGQVRAAIGRAGDGWQIRHASVHPDPIHLAASVNPDPIPLAASVNPDLVRLLADQPDPITAEGGRPR